MNNDFDIHQQIFKFVLSELIDVINDDNDEVYDYDEQICYEYNCQEEYDFDQTYDYDRYDYFHTQDDNEKLYGDYDDWEDYYDSIYG